MRILITNSYLSDNLYVLYHYLGLKNEAEVICSTQAFWTSSFSFDIIHLHWPEAILSCVEHQSNYFDKIKVRLDYWKKKGTKLVITRHNYKPHIARKLSSKQSEEVYDLFYTSVDAIVHHGQVSLNEFLNHSSYKKKVNILINHPNYLINTPNKISRTEARKMLEIEEDEAVFFSFGQIRHPEEEDIIIRGFDLLEIKKKSLIISNSFFLRNDKIKNEYYSTVKNIYAIDHKIENCHIQLYMNASDVVISPRINTLNSGVVFMGFSFGKVVIGPKHGNIGEILAKIGNPNFTPNNTSSIANAMKEGYSLSKLGLGEENLKYVKENCDIYRLGEEYLNLYHKLSTVIYNSL